MKSDSAKMAGVVVLGLLILAAGLIMLKVVEDPQGILLPLPYALIGVGCGVFGYGCGELLRRKVLESNPEIARAVEIERKDERNQMIANKAKARAYDITIYVFGLLVFVFGLMQVDLLPILMLTAAYLFVVFSAVFFMNRYNKDM